MTTSSISALQPILHRHWRKFYKRLKACRQRPSVEAVHDLRTATRRLLSIIELCRALQPRPVYGKTRKRLKKLLDQFDALRDTQVMLGEIAGTLPLLPDLQRFYLHLQQQEHGLLRDASHFIDRLRVGVLRRKIHKAERALKNQVVTPEIAIAVDQLYAGVMQRYQAMDANRLETIHALRIAVKKLRYTLAALQPQLSGIDDAKLRQLQDYLTCMGDIQNSAVLLQALQAFYPSGAPCGVLEHFQIQQQRLLDAFSNKNHEMAEFWRLIAQARQMQI